MYGIALGVEIIFLKGTDIIMKLKKITAAAISALIACVSLTTAASAYIEVVNDGPALLETTSTSWKMSISSKYGIDYTAAYKIEAIIKITDEEAYLADKASGSFSSGAAFTDFEGMVAFGGTQWLPYNFKTLDETEGGVESAAVKALGDSTYSISGITESVSVPAGGLAALTFSEWGCTTTDYGIKLISIALYDINGNVLISYDGSANVTSDLPAETTPAETEAVTEVPETTTTTTEATTTTAEETTTTTSAEETTVTEEAETADETEEAETEAVMATTTTAAAPETTSAETTSEELAETTTAASQAPVQTTCCPSSDNFSQRNSQLMVFAIAAIAIIVVVIVGFIIIAVKRKK